MELIKAYDHSDNELFADETPMWHPDSPFGSLELKYGFVLTKINLLNETTKEIIQLDDEIKTSKENYKYVPREKNLRPVILKMRLASELKIYTDELISIHTLLIERRKNGVWSRKISIDSIGPLIKYIDKKDYSLYKPFTQILNLINGLANGIKHSFLNSESLWYSLYKPESMLLGFYHKFNDLDQNKIEPFEIKLSKFIEEYNNLLSMIKSELKGNFLRH